MEKSHSKRVFKLFFTILFSILFSQQIWAISDLINYDQLAERGSTQDIQRVFNSDSSLRKQTFGENKETFLMLVLKHNRGEDVVGLCITNKCDVTAKAKDKRTPIMYAAQFSNYPSVIDELVKAGTEVGKETTRRVQAKDSSGKTSFDYAKMNSNTEIYAALKKYANDPAEEERIAREKKALKKSLSSKSKSKSKQKESAVAETTEATAAPEVPQELAAAVTEKAELSKDISEPKKDNSASKANENLKSSSQNKNQKAKESAENQNEKTLQSSTSSTSSNSNTAATSSLPKVSSSKEKLDDKEKQEDKISKNDKNPLVTETSGQNKNSSKNQENSVSDSAANLTSESQKLLSKASDKSTELELLQAQNDKLEAEQEAIKKENLELEKKAKEAQIKQYTQTFLYNYADEEKEIQSQEAERTVKIEDPNAADERGVTLLMKAAKAGNDWDVKKLIASGADVQTRDKDGWTALMYAVRYQNSVEIVKTLAENGAYLRVRNKYNGTPLLFAAYYSQNPQILELLLANRSISEDEVFKSFIFVITGETESDHLREAKINLYLNNGIQINRVWKGKTPLMYAAEYGSSTKTIQLLLDNGAKPGLVDDEGKTAFDYAKSNSKLKHDNTYWSLNSSAK